MATNDLTHASFFSGVGGTDLGLEAAGWRTVSFSEVDPYANAVLAERWPGVPNLGSITLLRQVQSERTGRGNGDAGSDEQSSDLWHTATLWSGGFPCQDLSVAGKRAGFAGERSVLAFAFLDLVRQHRPPAVLLENVPGLLSSHRGRDMARLVGELAELGYGWAYRILDARFFGVPQRRRRVFILGLRCEADDPDGRVAAERAAEVLSVGTRCDRHPATGIEAGTGAAEGTGNGADIVGSLSTSDSKNQQEAYVGHLRAVSPPSDADGVRAADGLAGRAHDRGGVVGFSQNQRGEVLTHEVAHQLTVGGGKPGQGYSAALGSFSVADDPLLPLGLDSHRYRCCGNGVVAPVAEWIGRRLADALS